MKLLQSHSLTSRKFSFLVVFPSRTIQNRLLKNAKFNSDKELTGANLKDAVLKGDGYKLGVFGITVPHLCKLHSNSLIFTCRLTEKIHVPCSLEKHTR